MKNIIEVDYLDESNSIPVYVKELGRANPYGTFFYKFERQKGIRNLIFDRIYISFKALKQGVLDGVRLVIGLDKCFLKGKYKGEILFAVGRVANNQSYPIT